MHTLLGAYMAVENNTDDDFNLDVISRMKLKGINSDSNDNDSTDNKNSSNKTPSSNSV